MFTRSDLEALMDASPSPGVSLFMPTHVRGSEIRQDPIRLKTLLAEARDALEAAGLDRGAAEALLAPAALSGLKWLDPQASEARLCSARLHCGLSS